VGSVWELIWDAEGREDASTRVVGGVGGEEALSLVSTSSLSRVLKRCVRGGAMRVLSVVGLWKAEVLLPPNRVNDNAKRVCRCLLLPLLHFAEPMVFLVMVSR